MQMRIFFKISLIFLFLILPSFSFALSLGEKLKFFVDPNYDLYGRKEINATLIKITNQLYFFSENEWWQKLDSKEKSEIEKSISDLATEFENKIYPKLTSTFGAEPNPGVDRDPKITILIHEMPFEIGGYTRGVDLFERPLALFSNQREMIYLNSEHIGRESAKVFLAHEFMHLITLNQKDILRNIEEETWLSELRSEYTETFLGYNEVLKGSQLESRIRAFVKNPNDSLLEWKNEKEDYAMANLLGHYLVDRFGIEVLSESLRSGKVGIESLNYFFEKRGMKTNFSQVFVDFLIALSVNNCNLGENYCFKNKHLQNFKITPTIYYLPGKESVLSTYHTISDWSGFWHKIIVGGNYVSLEFEGEKGSFVVPYLLCDVNEVCEIKFLNLDQSQKGKLEISNFKEKYYSLILIPISQFSEKESEGALTFSFSWKISCKEKEKTLPPTQPQPPVAAESPLIQLLKQLLNLFSPPQPQFPSPSPSIPQISCRKLEKNLYFGLKNDPEVRCLQEFLKSQGPQIYPEGLVTGNFLGLTHQAVIRFQEKYANEILKPLGLERGTGFVGYFTRQKINQLLGY